MPLRFGEFVLDPDARQLLRDGREVRLSPKAFDLLSALVTRRPDVLAKRDLLTAIWPDSFVVEANLNVVVAEIRRALGDDRQAPQFIRTVHKVGYAFCGQAVEVGDSAVAGSRCWLAFRDRAFALTEGANVVGRDPRSDVWLEHESVSRRHALIRVDGDAARVEDLGSTNGTFLGRERLAMATPLQDRDVVRVGALKLTFRMMSEKAARTRRLRR